MRIKREFVHDPHLVLYLPLYKLDGGSFKSHDAYGHLCTVTGATYGSQGRTFDATDDYITLPNVASLQNICDSPGGSIMAWIKPNSDGETDAGKIFTKTRLQFSVSADDGSKCKLSIYKGMTGAANGSYQTTDTVVTLGAWNFVAMTFIAAEGEVPVIYVNGVSVVVTTLSAGTGSPNSDAAFMPYVGGSAGDLTFDGGIGEVFAYKGKLLSRVEVSHIYNSTKWRYGVV